MNQKIETILQMSLEATDRERKAATELGVGYDSSAKLWEVIIKYAGDSTKLKEDYPEIQFTFLLNHYAIARLSIRTIEKLAAEPLIEFIEKPKRMYFQIISGKRSACIPSGSGNLGIEGLCGNGVIVAVIDSGINIYNREFLDMWGNSRILALWDQTANKVYDNEMINAALKSGVRSSIGNDVSGHGTKVATIACGNSGVASKASIVVVKMGLSQENDFPRTTRLMEAVDFVIRKGIEEQKPVAVNISFGNNYGDHCQSSLIERYIADSTLNWKLAFCIGSGNENLGATHTGGYIESYSEQEIELAIGGYETSISVQIWKDYWDEFDVELITPTGKTIGRITENNNIQRFVRDETKLLIMYGQPSPYSMKQEIYIEMMAADENFGYIRAGVWKIRLISKKIIGGRYDMWLPSLVAINMDTGFLKPDNYNTCTIPSTARRVISVGAYDSRTDTPAAFSGRGYIHHNESTRLVKPELIAPGVDIMLNETDSCTGTSFATPFVTGAAALLMEWGIVKGNDPYLYGEKLKAYLIKGAAPVRGENQYPSPRVGYGCLCVRDSIPK